MHKDVNHRFFTLMTKVAPFYKGKTPLELINGKNLSPNKFPGEADFWLHISSTPRSKGKTQLSYLRSFPISSCLLAPQPQIPSHLNKGKKPLHLIHFLIIKGSSKKGLSTFTFNYSCYTKYPSRILLPTHLPPQMKNCWEQEATILGLPSTPLNQTLSNFSRSLLAPNI